MLTTTLNRHPGTIFLAKNYEGETHVKTFANETQASNAAEKAGDGFEVIKYVDSRPWFVGRDILACEGQAETQNHPPETETMKTPETIIAAINQIKSYARMGTVNYHRHWSGMVYTDGVAAIAEAAGAYWLIDVIASHQHKVARAARKDARLIDFQGWELSLDGKGGCRVRCRADSDVRPCVSQGIGYTDYPEDLNLCVMSSEHGPLLMLPEEN